MRILVAGNRYFVLVGDHLAHIGQTAERDEVGPVARARARVIVANRDSFARERAWSWGCGEQDHFGEITDYWRRVAYGCSRCGRPVELHPEIGECADCLREREAVA